ncbi:MAG: asparagine synthase C-terminal domain-containing protein [Ignavibacteria bacterium]|nr:asparagine synthase C-terminal domain-containing protein [Ignavibacteria bacterium]
MYNSFCLSSFLAFRYVVKDGLSWKDGISPIFPKLSKKDQTGVASAEEVINVFRNQLRITKNTGILLSAGIDSAILASFLPAGTKAYTIRFIAEGAVDESEGAAVFADKMSLSHTVVDVFWEDYLKYSDILMKRKKSPLHAIEVALYKAALTAKQDGIDQLIVGNGADSTFGGMDKLLSKDWTYEEFKKRYTFVEPSDVLKDFEDIDEVYRPYKKEAGIEVSAFLKTVHGIGIVQTFNNAIEAAGCKVLTPYESLFLDAHLDIERIRNGESKYILRKVFENGFPNYSIPEKIPFARPMDQWLSNWEGPSRPEFLDNIDIKKFTGDQKWIIYCLERFMNLFDGIQ